MSDSGGVRHIRIGGHLYGEDELYNLFVPVADPGGGGG